ncbi:hypothetical protein FQN57_006377 [Myotisia sp. PD_48]|nr:hypothetical protein FQN57_006377 [Myotisia sp. PD_48]
MARTVQTRRNRRSRPEQQEPQQQQYAAHSTQVWGAHLHTGTIIADMIPDGHNHSPSPLETQPSVQTAHFSPITAAPSWNHPPLYLSHQSYFPPPLPRISPFMDTPLRQMPYAYTTPLFTPLNLPPNAPFSTLASRNAGYGHTQFDPSRRSPSPVPQPVAPIPEEEYLSKASLAPETIASPQPLLVILDLNGTLIYRKSRKHPPTFTKRPGLDQFLNHLFSNYKVMIWTSSQPKTVTAVLEKLLPPSMRRELMATWSRQDLDLTHQQYSQKVQVYKRLNKVWADGAIQSRYPSPNAENTGQTAKKANKKKYKLQNINTALKADLYNQDNHWNQTNTVLIDDSRLKAAGQPYNIIEIPEFTNDSTVDEIKNLTIVMRQLEVLSYQKDVSRKLKEWNKRQPDVMEPSQLCAFWENELGLSSADFDRLKGSTNRIVGDKGQSNNPEARPESSDLEDGGVELGINSSNPNLIPNPFPGLSVPHNNNHLFEPNIEPMVTMTEHSLASNLHISSLPSSPNPSKISSPKPTKSGKLAKRQARKAARKVKNSPITTISTPIPSSVDDFTASASLSNTH